ncbi:MAG: HDIG domain-containing protein [Spirochaetaceae bacterium]|nr:HDIG domain-containing protein [Spirochaetaceae bacterium]
MKTNKPLLARVSGLFPKFSFHDSRYFWNSLACLIAAALMLFLVGPGSTASNRNFDGISPGKLAEKDIITGKDVVYVDKAATQLRIETEEHLVLPIFKLDASITTRTLNDFKAFADGFRELADQNTATETMVLMLMSRFPGMLSDDVLSSLARSPLKLQMLVYAEDILSSLLGIGIFSIPSEGLESFNQDYFELEHTINNKAEFEQRPQGSMVTRDDLPRAINEQISQKRLANSVSTIVSKLVLGFATENAFFDKTQSQNRLAKVRSKVEPVTRAVGENEVLVKKGEMVTEETYARIMSIKSAVSRADIGLLLSGLGLLCTAAFVGFFFLSRQKNSFGASSQYGGLLSIYSSLAFFIIVMFANRASLGSNNLEGAYFVPTALFVGIASAIGGQNFGFAFSVILGLLSASASNMNADYIVFTVFSGIFMSFMSSSAKTRLSLAKSTVGQALVQCGLAAILLMHSEIPFPELARTSGLMALNGFVSGALILAILPVLEQGFNLPTRFRLMELSDVNAPALKDLMTLAPGTYAHSLNVAHLAEAAAEEIGANALLARVGSYYHDLGKIDQPEYFVENQRGQNKHDDINPRLSATVIRSHVKLGVEKGKELGLPKAVVDIVAQHHGNSTIAWFYDKAKTEDPTINEEDFSYPGSPPTTKEAGIVMLADSVEAALRTIKKPSLPRLDAFIRQLIMEKVQQGQLDDCPLTLKDLETIRHVFVRITAGQFHSRIEYPSQKESGS